MARSNSPEVSGNRYRREMAVSSEREKQNSAYGRPQRNLAGGIPEYGIPPVLFWGLNEGTGGGARRRFLDCPSALLRTGQFPIAYWGREGTQGGALVGKNFPGEMAGPWTWRRVAHDKVRQFQGESLYILTMM
jgi:hypothetical protein